jgi:hypothetical protein
MSRENLNRYYGPPLRKNKCQKCSGKFYVIYSKAKIGVALKENCDIPAFFHMGAVPKGWKLI